MQVTSFMAIKGGVGKTTMAFQLAKFLQTANSIINPNKNKKKAQSNLLQW
ncbi:hypothetical protein [Lactiplantibacillus plantarum]|nr:hypothetical protein [Lactiplantibacillus plantarum]